MPCCTYNGVVPFVSDVRAQVLRSHVAHGDDSCADDDQDVPDKGEHPSCVMVNELMQ